MYQLRPPTHTKQSAIPIAMKINFCSKAIKLKQKKFWFLFNFSQKLKPYLNIYFLANVVSNPCLMLFFIGANNLNLTLFLTFYFPF